MKAPITSHFFLTRILTVLCCVALCCVTPACSSDEPDSGGDNEGSKPGIGSNRAVTLKDDGTTSDGGTYSWLSDGFVIDGIRYRINGEELTVINLSDDFTSAEVKPYSTVAFRKIKYTTTAIGECAFSKKEFIKTIILPSTVRTIGKEAMLLCTGLVSCDLPEELQTIAESAFRECHQLTGLKIPSGVSGIGARAFEGCGSITEAAIPDGMTTIPERCFDRCAKLQTIDIPGSVTAIGDAALRNCSSLRAVELPERLTAVGWQAFSSCASLKSLYFHDSDQPVTIDSKAFILCKGLEDIHLPEGLKNISSQLFKDCSSLHKVSFPASVSSMSEYAFEGCVFDEVDLSACNLNGIAGYAFYSAKIKILKLPSTITGISISAFEGFSSDEFTIPETVDTISSYAFSHAKFQRLSIPNDIDEFYTGAFAYCSGVKSVEIQNDDYIPDKCFEHCPELEYVSIGTGVRTISNEAFYSCSKLKTVEFEQGIKTIKPYAFASSGISGDLTLPEGLETIEEFAFRGTNISSIVFPSTIKTLNPDILANCNNLRDVVFKCPPPYIDSIDGYFFDGWYYKDYCAPVLGLKYDVNVYVPDEYIEQYRSMQAFWHIENLLPLSQYQGQ